MELIKQFKQDSFCNLFINKVLPDKIRKSYITTTPQGETKFEEALLVEIEKIKKKSTDKFDIGLQVAITYKRKYIMDERRYYFEFNDYLNKHYFKPLHIVVREELKMERNKVIEAMRNVFRANVLFLRFYDREENKSDLKEYFLNHNIILILNQEFQDPLDNL